MQKILKTKLIPFSKKFFCYFSLYGLIPLISCCFVVLFLFIQVKGGSVAEETITKLGEKTLLTYVGTGSERQEEEKGFYFFSQNFIPPTHGKITAFIGTFIPRLTPAVPKTPDKKVEVVYESLPPEAKPVISCDLSSPSYFINTTKYEIDVEKARNSAFPSGTNTSEKPLVLVLHTHGTECYFEDNTNLSDFAGEGIESYLLEGSTSFRTTDPEKSVVAVGKVFSDTLNASGIPTLHCTVMHDKDDFNQAYVNSAETVKAMLKTYPSIQYVVDLHRDSVVRGESYVKSLTTIENTPCAQVMLVVGTNQNGRHPNWEQNLVVATGLKDRMDQMYPTLSRSLYLRTARFNQEYLPGCMLLEVGSAANTLEEAKTAASFAALSFADLIKSKG